MAASGFLHVSSKGTTYNTHIPLTNSHAPLHSFFGTPVNAGTLTTIGVPIYKSGTPPAVPILLEIWEAKSGGDPWTVVGSGSNWELLSTATLDNSSVAAGSLASTNIPWVACTVDTPVYLDSAPKGFQQWGADYVEQEAISRYAFKVFISAAGCTQTFSHAYHFQFKTTSSQNMGWDMMARNNTARQNADQQNRTIQYYLAGLTSTSSLFFDRPAPDGMFGNGRFNEYAGENVINNTNPMAAGKFTAVGSFITRVAVGMHTDGTVVKPFYGVLMTHNVSSGLPETVVATSQLIVAGSDATRNATLLMVDANSASMGPQFVFSSAPVTSGNFYWFGVQAHSYNSTGQNISLTLTVSCRNLVYWNSSSTKTHLSSGYAIVIQPWYTDSETLAVTSADHGYTAPPTPPSGGLSRLYPSTFQRRYPELIGRKYPL